MLQLAFQSTPNKGSVTSTPDGLGWLSLVDASDDTLTGGDDSYTYAKFAADGLTKVNISDIDSLTWVEWDIAFHRHVVRINSEDSGPSCVQAARVSGSFENVTGVPEGLTYQRDDFFTKACTFVQSPSGPDGSPATALSSYSVYDGCLKMSGQVFVVHLANGRHLKLVVDDYYKPTTQDECNTTGAVDLNGPGAGHFAIRWSYLD